ncbi:MULTISPECIES: twin-arginine translocase subunit TatC [Parabacteroides]|jgi:sec-independent protein translocase protein TatC|uniref:twin-arginine translocase subunit TatC n=1 Tax=Parabacteroides TaxID=375288 RepID=UPI000EFF93A2|nr:MULTISPECIES: twin-arginine translocase subunit TatC [Parabacteroides]RHU27153.1 twin-arginine translocase subunit TatC [Parabacteroides sp. TM07-1AC]WFE84547.1 twin-arginine translocase subunit TatC [Parabacteroides chongii]
MEEELEQDEMSFWDHLEELRWTLFRSILALFVFAIGSFAFMRDLFDHVIMAPCYADFILYRWLCELNKWLIDISPWFDVLPDFCNDTFHVDIVNIKLASQFFTHMTTSFWLALVLTFPYLMYEVWRFISPALYENEKKNIRWVFFFGTIMFFLGCAVGYFMVFPMTLRFLATYQLSANITEQVSLDSYMDNFLMLIFVMGIVFEMPLVSWLLSKLGLLHRGFFHKYRRHAIVGLLVAAAFITPSSDPFTLSVVFFPLYGLYELSAFFVRKAPVEQPDEEDEEENEG